VNTAATNTLHDGGVGAVYLDAVDTLFDVAMLPTLAVRCDVLFRVGFRRVCALDLVAVRTRNRAAVCITDNDTDKLGVSDPGVAAPVRMPGHTPGSLTPSSPH
jgi:hypothetical protein